MRGGLSDAKVGMKRKSPIKNEHCRCRVIGSVPGGSKKSDPPMVSKYALIRFDLRLKRPRNQTQNGYGGGKE